MPEEAAETKGEGRYPDDGQSQIKKVLGRRHCFFAQGQNNILDKAASEAMHDARVPREHSHKHDRAKEPFDSLRQKVSRRDGHCHLVAKGVVADGMQLGMGGGGLAGKVGINEKRHCADGENRPHEGEGKLPPESEYARHARFVRIPRGATAGRAATV